jgi:tRNA(Ile)-lysidine synthase
MHAVDPGLVARFRADTDSLAGYSPERLGIAVSGGPDSLALLLLAAAAYPGAVEAATMDHGLRATSVAEAAFVASVCRDLDLPHAILAPGWERPPKVNVQARARAARYEALSEWAAARGLSHVATGHHLDDQAETLLLRLGRGSGVGGLTGIRPSSQAPGPVPIIRPLLQWSRTELREIVAAAGIEAVDDPSNADPAFDRTRARAMLAQHDWLAPSRLAASAAAAAEADEALEWTADQLFSQRGTQHEDGTVSIDPHHLPHELQRRLLLRALAHFTDWRNIPGPKLIRLLDALLRGEAATLAGVRILPGPRWRLSPAPPRRDAPR